MKRLKVLFIMIIVVCVLSGCGSSETPSSRKTLDINTAKSSISSLKIGDTSPFSDESNINNSDSIETYGLDTSLLEEYAIYLPSAVVNASMYIIAKPKNGEESVVKYQIKDLFEKYYNAYNGYYPKEAKLIENRMEKKLNGYLIYIVSSDNDKVYNTIKENLK